MQQNRQQQQQRERALRSFHSGFETRARMDQMEVQLRAKDLLPAEWRDAVANDDKCKQLLAWFKKDFFVWVNSPECAHCAHKSTKCVQTRAAQTAREGAGLVSIVEMYECEACARVTDFPRYNHPLSLFESRRGRCGEFANCFCVLAIAAGFETRYVLDLTDHVWAEVFSKEQGRWIHCDPCENAFDSPLLYESGWNKQLSFCFAYERSSDAGGVVVGRDVTRRYSRKWDGDMILRRLGVLSPALVRALRASSSSAAAAHPSEQAEFAQCVLETTMKRRLPSRKLKPEEEQGRISGSVAWKAARGEDGKNKAAPSEADKERFQQRFRALVAQGLAPNQAAARALQEFKRD